MKLFHSNLSPFVRKVMIVAIERGVRDRIELLPSKASPMERDGTIVPHNPSGKVPTAILSDGTSIFDSRVICRYVDGMATGPGLYPEDETKFAVLTLEALADSILDACILCRYERLMRPAEKQFDAWYDAQMGKVVSGLAALENEWFPSFSGSFHAGAVAIAAMLGYLDFRFADFAWREGHPKLAAWFAEVSARPSMQQTMPV